MRIAGVAAALFVALSVRFFALPPQASPRRAGAILSLDGNAEGARSHLAVRLAEEGYAPVLIFSQGNWRTTPCPRVPGTRVVCFWPHPARTIGEVAYGVAYARRHGIHRLLIVSGWAQTTRARLLAHRCFRGTATVVSAPMPAWQVPFEVAYEWGATARALLGERAC